MFNDKNHSKLVQVILKMVNLVAFSLVAGQGLRNKLILLYIFLRWKLILLVSRRFSTWLPAMPMVKIIFNGRLLAISIPPDTAFAQMLYELFVREDYKVQLPRPPSCILDAGANCGLASLYFLTLYPQAVIHSFEPSAASFHYLKRNTQDYSNIQIHHMGLFSHTGTARLYLPESGGQNSLVEKNDHFEEIKITLLDEFMASHQIRHVDLLKIDVEGSEEEILTTSQRLNDIDFISGELHLKMIDKDRVLKALAPHFNVVCVSHEPDLDVVTAKNKRLG